MRYQESAIEDKALIVFALLKELPVFIYVFSVLLDLPLFGRGICHLLERMAFDLEDLRLYLVFQFELRFNRDVGRDLVLIFGLLFRGVFRGT